MNFGEALKECLNGKLITNEKWNGKGQYVFMMKGYPTIPANQALSMGAGIPVGENVTVAPYLMMKNAQGVFVTWVPSTGDIFSEGWNVISDGFNFSKILSTNTSNSATITYRDSKTVDCEMDLIEAFQKMEFEGKKIARKDWNGAYLIFGCDSKIGYINSIMKVSKDGVTCYSPGIKDTLANDWVVVE